MAHKADQFRQSDVPLWGMVALLCAGLAVLSASAPALLPPGALGGLHATQANGGSVNQMRAQLAELELETMHLRREAGRLSTQLALAEQGRTDMTRRVGAIEATLPMMAEAMATGGNVDRGLVTASIGGEDHAESFAAEGGSVTLRHTPLLSGAPAEDWPDQTWPDQTWHGEVFAEQPLPEAIDLTALAPDVDAFAPARDHGVALGGPVTDAETALAELRARAGPLLLGLQPRLSPPDEGGRIWLVFGPIADAGLAAGLCDYVIGAGIDCRPALYDGEALGD